MYNVNEIVTVDVYYNSSEPGYGKLAVADLGSKVRVAGGLLDHDDRRISRKCERSMAARLVT